MKELCGCCEGLEKLTPLDTYNRPGLDALSYRVGTHATFLKTMMARLTTLHLDVAEEREGVGSFCPLRHLTTRSFDDPSLALLDAWATVADVLTFYQEQIANEGYLRTARERRSILELARLVGYKLRPGVSASVFLAFDLEKGYDLLIEPGLRAQSLPGPGELPQPFETAEPLEARTAWNRLGVKMTRPQYIDSDNIDPENTGFIDRAINKVYLAGTATNLKPNDLLLFRFEGDKPEPVFRWVESIETQSVENRTIVTLQPQKSQSSKAVSGMEAKEENSRQMTREGNPSDSELLITSLSKKPSLPPASPRKLERKVIDAFAKKSDIGTQMLINLAPVLRDRYYPAWSSVKNASAPSQVKSVEALRVKAAPFGHNAPLEFKGIIKETKLPKYEEWDLVEDNKTLYLDAEYDKILPESWVVIERPGNHLICKATEVRAVSRAAYGIAGKVTRLTLDHPVPQKEPKLDVLRDITVYAQGEALPLAEEVIDPEKLVDRIVDGNCVEERVNDICKDQIELDGLYDGLKSGRWVIVSGERTDIAGASGVKASELVMLAGATQKVGAIDKDRLPRINSETGETEVEVQLPGDRVHTFLTLAKPLEYCYKRDTVSIYANVAKATHGETRYQVLGSGDGGKAFQEFQLPQSPLTYLAAPTPAGSESTLQVRVNDVLWHEAESLAGLEPIDRKYILMTDDQSKTSVFFGNGLRGSRLPSGTENVRAVYRTGIGKPGNVKAEQISLLAARPLGVKGVINPLPATGGADRESRDQARRNAPLAVLALDRLVSVQDYADFVRTFAGIGKARATEITNGRRQMILLTIAGSEDIPIDEHSDLYQNLVSALHKYGDPHLPIRVEMRELLMLVVSANVRVHPDYLWDKVEPNIRAAMLDAFSFEHRELGQDVFLSEVISVIQAVEGVDYVDVDVLVSVPEKEFESKIKIFCWDEVPGKDEGRLKEFLTRRFGFDWVKTAKINKYCGGKTIQLSAQNGSLSLELDETNNEVTLGIDPVINTFSVKKEGHKLSIYPTKGSSETRRNLTPDETLNWVQDRNDECISEFKRPYPRIPVNLASMDKDGVLWPDQIAYLNPDIPDTLILKEVKP